MASAAVVLGGSVLACRFTPPPPLPEELAKQEEEAAARREAVNGGDPADPETLGSAQGGTPGEDGSAAGGEGGEAGEASGPPPAATDTGGFTKGQLADVGMTPAQMQAYARAQGDPHGGVFSLDEALVDLPGSGELWADFHTTQGVIACRLFEDQTPLTVANFVGLARGLRTALGPDQQTWTAEPYYDSGVFHRVIPGFMIQGGDPTGSGRGGTGYVIPDEFVPGLVHDVPGILSMANRGPGTGGGQFFITLAPTPHLDGRHTVFGRCDDAGVGVAEKIAATRGAGDRPRTPQSIERVVIERR